MYSFSPPLAFPSHSPSTNRQSGKTDTSSTPRTKRTPLLDSLLKASRKTPKPSSFTTSSSNATAYPNNLILPSTSSTGGIIQEIAWTSEKVTWYKGTTVYRTFSFASQGQPIRQALFARFQVSFAGVGGSDSARKEASSHSLTPEGLAAKKSTNDEDYATSPFHPHASTSLSWTDSPTPLPLLPTPSLEQPESVWPLHLVILLSDIGFIYPINLEGGHDGGGSIPLQLPFRVKRAWGLDKGLMLERERDGGDAHALGSEERELPTLYSLMDPKEEIKVVMRSQSGIAGLSHQAIPKASAGSNGSAKGKGKGDCGAFSSPSTLGSVSAFQDLNHDVVFTSTNEMEPIFVTHNRLSRKLCLWSYGRIPRQNRRSSQEARDGEEAADETNATSTLIPSLHIPGTISSTNKRKRTSINALPMSSPLSRQNTERNTRRSTLNPNLTISGTGGPSSVITSTAGFLGEEDLLVALGAESVMRRSGSNISNPGISAPDRRTSLTRNELSITMDRMALGVGGLGTGNGITGAANLLGTGSRAGVERGAGSTDISSEGDENEIDICVDLIWESEVAGEDGLGESISAHLFDTRATSDETTSTLALHIPSQSTLLLFRISRSNIGKLVATPIVKLSAKCCIPVMCSRSTAMDLAYFDEEGKWFAVTAAGRPEEIQAPRLPSNDSLLAGQTVDIIKIEGDYSRSILVTLKGGDRHLVRIRESLGPFAKKVLETLSLVMEMTEFSEFLREVMLEAAHKSTLVGVKEIGAVLGRYLGMGDETEVNVSGAGEDAWSQFLRSTAGIANVEPILHFLPQSTSEGVVRPKVPSSRQARRISESHLQAIMIAIHLLGEDAKIMSEGVEDFEQIQQLQFMMADAFEAQDWVDKCRRGVTSAASSGPTGLSFPANLMASLHHLLSSQPGSFTVATEECVRPFDLSFVASSFDIHPSYYYGFVNPLSNLTNILSIYSLLAPVSVNLVNTGLERAQLAVLAMNNLGWTLETIAKFAFGIGLPLREAIRLCQIDTPENWPQEAYELVRRPDLAKQMGAGNYGMPLGKPKKKTASMSSSAIDVICANVLRVPTPISSEPRGLRELSPVVPQAVRFNEDRRLDEVRRILQFSTPVTIAAGEKTLDQLTPPVQQGILTALSCRTLALPVGCAMFYFRFPVAAHIPETVNIPCINTSARILPMVAPVALIDKDTRDGTTTAETHRNVWPDFHSGVAAALVRPVGSPSFDSAQISFHRPVELDARHAGFLMGLGLVGDLGAMVFNQAFEYLKMKHDPTSIGLLLGLAVTYVGTADPKVTSLLSVHVAALHPPNSNPLNVSGITQAAGLVGMGLLYLGTQRRTLADIMVAELCSIKVTSIEDPAACREAYALSAGFAFGMINLGKGSHAAAGSLEVGLLRTFRALILGESNHPLPGSAPSQDMTDVNITSSAATIAMGLMFLRTERSDVSEMLEIPDTARRLDYVRSDLLLLRTLSRSIIMWDTISTSKEWVESHVPSFIVNGLSGKISSQLGEGELEIARWNIIAGACFAVGLKYAGTATAEAHGTLLYYWDRLHKAAYVKASTVQGKIKRHAVRCCLSVVIMSVSMVMAGTGELNVLRRLRVAHSHFSEGVTYGSHLASHMALGILFVGNGLYTLGTSNCAIAAMLLAFYPSFPSTSMENRAHLQAYRHLWTLAVEPRCVQVRDVDTEEPVFLPLRLRLLEKGNTIRAKPLVAPTLIPEIRLIESIHIDSPRYWGFQLHLASNPSHLARFLRNGIIYVKRRTGHLSYAQDPRGIRSIFTRSKSETGSSVFDFGEMSRFLAPSAGGLRDFVTAFSDDAESIASVDYLCQPPPTRNAPTAFEAFSASVLLECLTKDKRDMIGVYQAMYHAFQRLKLSYSPPTLSSSPSVATLLGTEQLEFVVNFYQGGAYRWLSAKPKGVKNSSSRESLIQPAFIRHVARNNRAVTNVGSPSDQLLAAFETYLENYTWPSDRNLGSQLSMFLLLHNSPSLSDLKMLKTMVHEYMSINRERLLGPEVKESLRVLVRVTSKTIKKSGGVAWTAQFGDWMIHFWYQQSITLFS